MDFQALAVLKMAIVAGLAYLSYRKTCKLNQIQQKAFVNPNQCIIRQLGREIEPLERQQIEEKKDEQVPKLIKYSQFVSIYKDLPAQDSLMESEEDLQDQLPLQLEALEFQKSEEGFSTIAPDTRRESLSMDSQLISQSEDYFDRQNQSPPINNKYFGLKNMWMKLRLKKNKLVKQRQGKSKKQKNKIRKQFCVRKVQGERKE